MEQHILPVIDLGPFTIPGYKNSSKQDILKQLDEACASLGCFYLKNHGIDPRLRANLISDLRSFFDQPMEYKQKYIDPSGNVNRGYVAFEKQNANAFMGRKGLPNDPIEKYQVSPPDSNLNNVDENLWPNFPPTFKENHQNYYESLKKLAYTLMHVLSLALDTPGYEDFFYRQCFKAEHRLKSQIYPPYAQKKPMQFNRLAEHTDTSPFAILTSDACPGSLELFDDHAGQWLSIPPYDDMFIMNLGDPMARWTNDRWKAPLHKVTWPETQNPIGRLSIVFFAHGNKDATLDSIPNFVKEKKAKYEPISYDDYVERKLNALGNY